MKIAETWLLLLQTRFFSQARFSIFLPVSITAPVYNSSDYTVCLAACYKTLDGFLPALLLIPIVSRISAASGQKLWP